MTEKIEFSADISVCVFLLSVNPARIVICAPPGSAVRGTRRGSSDPRC